MEVKNNRVTMIPLNVYTTSLSGDSRQDLSISLNKHAKGGKTALLGAVPSGDSRNGHSTVVVQRLYAIYPIRNKD